MIARIWQGRTPASLGDEYFEYLKKTGIEECRSTDGNGGVFVMRRIENGVAEFQMITLWDSFEAIKKFSGPDVEKAVYFPDDKKYLLEQNPQVFHFEILQTSVKRTSSHEGSFPRLIRYMKGIKF